MILLSLVRPKVHAAQHALSDNDYLREEHKTTASLFHLSSSKPFKVPETDVISSYFMASSRIFFHEPAFIILYLIQLKFLYPQHF